MALSTFSPPIILSILSTVLTYAFRIRMIHSNQTTKQRPVGFPINTTTTRRVMVLVVKGTRTGGSFLLRLYRGVETGPAVPARAGPIFAKKKKLHGGSWQVPRAQLRRVVDSERLRRYGLVPSKVRPAVILVGNDESCIKSPCFVVAPTLNYWPC